MRIDHRGVVRVGAHLAGAERVVDRGRGSARIGVEVGVGGLVGAGRDLDRRVRLHRALMEDFTRDADAGADEAQVVVGRQEIDGDTGCRRRIGRREADGAAAFRPQRRRSAAEAVGVGLFERREVRPGIHRRDPEQELHVRHVGGGVALYECHHVVRKARGEAGAEEMRARKLRHDAVAVSYTHLDVYKRQHMLRLRVPACIRGDLCAARRAGERCGIGRELLFELGLRQRRLRMARERLGGAVRHGAVGGLDLDPRQIARFGALQLAARERAELGRRCHRHFLLEEGEPCRIAHARGIEAVGVNGAVEHGGGHDIRQ